MEYPRALSDKLEQTGFWFIFVNMLFASYLLVYHPEALAVFLREDSIAETAGALFLLITGGVLLLAAFELFRRNKGSHRSTWWRILLLLGAGVLFLAACGEEISWGQRIFEINTPELFEKINRQNEMNFHNLDTRLFNNAIETVILLMILVPTIWMHRGKDRLLGFVLPSYWIILCLVLVACYVTYSYIKTQDYIAYLVLIYFLFRELRSKNWKKLGYVLGAILIVILVGVLNVNLREMHPNNGPREFREYVFSFTCLLYAMTIYLDIKYSRCFGSEKT